MSLKFLSLSTLSEDQIQKNVLWSKDIDSFTLKNTFLNQQNFLQFKAIFCLTVYKKKLFSGCTHFFDSKRKKKQSRNFFKSKKLFFYRIALSKFIWFKVIIFESKKLFSGSRLSLLSFLVLPKFERGKIIFHERNLKWNFENFQVDIL